MASAADGGEGVRDRHTAYYVAALERWWADLKGPHRRQAMAEIEIEFGNVSAAWEWAAGRRQVERLDRAMDALGLFSYASGRAAEASALFQLAAEQFEAADRSPTPPLSGGELRVWSRISSWHRLAACRRKLSSQIQL